MTDHNARQFATDLAGKLASSVRHVCLFLGAGASKACEMPDVQDLQDTVTKALESEDQAALARQLENSNLEGALSRLRRIASLVRGMDTVDGLSAEKAAELDSRVCQAIVAALAIENANIEPMAKLAAWIVRAEYRLPLEIFTVNYDLLLETALERQGIPYFDGFVGSIRARFRTDLVEALPPSDQLAVPSLFVRLWKLHGSVNWESTADHEIIRLGHPVAGDLAAAIYPSDAKYTESRRVPFLVLQDRFRRALDQPETLVLVSGYSFGDSDLNELIFDAAARRQRSEFIAFCFSDIPPALASLAVKTPNLQAVSPDEGILGGLRGEWSGDESIPGLWQDGRMLLGDFGSLAAYLSRSAAGSHSASETIEADMFDGNENASQEARANG